MSDVSADVAAFVAADTTDVLSAAKAAGGGTYPAITQTFNSKANVQW